MNYDAAYALQTAMKNSDEFKRLKEVEAKIEVHSESKELVRKFLTMQMEMEYLRMAGSEEAEAKMKELQEFSYQINGDEVAREFLQAYTTWVKVCEDIHRIVMEQIKEGISIFEEK